MFIGSRYFAALRMTFCFRPYAIFSVTSSVFSVPSVVNRLLHFLRAFVVKDLFWPTRSRGEGRAEASQGARVELVEIVDRVGFVGEEPFGEEFGVVFGGAGAVGVAAWVF
jgi:hypothetical protein